MIAESAACFQRSLPSGGVVLVRVRRPPHRVNTDTGSRSEETKRFVLQLAIIPRVPGRRNMYFKILSDKIPGSLAHVCDRDGAVVD